MKSAFALTAWVAAREAMRQRKEQGAMPPWADDAILSKFRFCNVRRRDDRVSRWIQREVILGREQEPSLGMFLALCRWVNWPPTILEIMDFGLWPAERADWRAIGLAIDARKRRGLQAWTGAFMVRGEQKSHGHAWAHWGKGRYVAEVVVQRELEGKREDLQEALRGKRRQVVASILESCYGWGSFMAGQIVDDWSWAPLLANATDTYTWAPQGPGSRRGLNRLLGRPLTATFKGEEWCERLIELRESVIRELGNGFADMTLMDLQNCLCEYDKYERVRLGEGRPRSYYRPETAY